jgi:hypothetical protein
MTEPMLSNLHIVPQTDFAHPLQLFASPHTAGWVMRTTEKKQPCTWIAGFFFKVIKINGVSPVRSADQTVVQNVATSFLRLLGEFVLTGSLNQDTITRLGEH